MFSRRFVSTAGRGLSTGARLFDNASIRANLKPSTTIIDAVESAFGKLAKNEVDVPIPMHIGTYGAGFFY